MNFISVFSFVKFNKLTICQVRSFAITNAIKSNILKANHCLLETLNNILKILIINKWHA